MYHWVRRIRILKVEALVGQVSRLNRDKTPPFGQAVPDGGIDDPKLIISRPNPRPRISKFALLINIRGFQPCTEPQGVKEADP